MGFRRTCELCGSLWDAAVAFCPRDGQGLGPAKLDRYILVREVSRTAMSEVFEAQHEFTKKRVALKLIRADTAGHDDRFERLRREGRAASAMGDPNIVDITDFGMDDDGGLYMVMEWLDGKTLRELLNEGPMSTELALDLASQIASGLAAAHGIGVVHRDVKPENLMVIEGKDGSLLLKILDFGIAKVAGHELEKLTRTGTIVGTPAYMSPEQAREDPVDARSDVYSLGCVIYELFTGNPPFTSPSVMEVVCMHVDSDPTVPSISAPMRQIPEAVDQVIMRCIAKEPGQRFSSMTALRKELLNLANQGTTPILEVTTTEKFDMARTFHFHPESGSQGLAAPIAIAPIAQSAPLADPALPSPKRSKRALVLGLVVIAFAAVAGVALWGNNTSSDPVAKSSEPDANRERGELSDLPGKEEGELSEPPGKQDAGTRQGGPSDATASETSPATLVEPSGNDSGPVESDIRAWTAERTHSKFTVVLSASGILAPRAPIDLQFKLKNLKDRVSWAVTEGRLQARIEFVHFVRHDTMGRVTANVNDQGEFRAILSVPQTGKYHLKIRLSDGSKVLGRSQVDICVGALPGSPEADSLCPKLGELSGHHGAAR